MKVTLELDFKIVLRWLLGLLLVWAAISKLGNLQDFYASLLAYKLPLPDVVLRGTAITLPWLELLCGSMLLAKIRLETALGWAIVLFTIFTVATGVAWLRGLDISCGCFNLHSLGLDAGENGRLAKMLESVWFAFFRAVLLLAASVYLWRHASVPETQPVRS
jgi:putative oxidoreductase